MKAFVSSLQVVLCGIVLVTAGYAQEDQIKSQPVPLSTSRETSIAPTSFPVLSEVTPSLVHIYWRGEKRSRTERTPGFALANGMFATVRESAKVAESVIIRSSQSDREAQVVLIDSNSGLVLVKGTRKAGEEVPPMELGTSRQLYIGDPAFALALDQEGQPEQAVDGILIGRDRRVEGKELPVAHLRVRIPNALSFGGLPLLDGRGRVIGIDLGRRLDDNGEEFHVLPIEVASKLATDLLDFGKREDAWLGVTFNTGTTTAKVVSVRPGSPGDQADMKPGDVVIYFGGARIDTLDDLSDTCYCLTPGRSADIHFLRGVTRVQKQLTPAPKSAKPQAVGPKP
ncbi:MAG: PDZ domain-containing protein [Verrucomicrobiota bacterium]